MDNKIEYKVQPEEVKSKLGGMKIYVPPELKWRWVSKKRFDWSEWMMPAVHVAGVIFWVVYIFRELTIEFGGASG